MVSVSQREQLASTPELPLPKGNGTEPSVQNRGERVKVSESCTLAREREIRARARRGEDGLHSEKKEVLKKERKGKQESLPRTSRRKHEQVSGRKSSPDESARVLVLL